MSSVPHPSHRVHEVRPGFSRGARARPDPAEVTRGLQVTDEVIDGPHGPVPLRRYRLSEGSRPVAPFVWAHGGGFSVGDLEMPESHAFAAAIARSGREVVAVDYRLVPFTKSVLLARDRPLPGVRHPVPMDDVATALEHVAAGATDGRAVLGEPARAPALGAAASLRAVREGLVAPDRLVFVYGLFHPRLPPASADVRAKTRGRFVFTPAMISRVSHNYAGSLAKLADPYAFAGGHDLAGLPPTLLVDAEHDSLRASGEAFGAELARAGVSVRRFVVARSSHAFLNRPLSLDFAVGVRTITAWLDATDEP
ncbi:MAG: alpha/beta hydrolase fold domain-containing protein [Micropruina sp.]|nr:MAG: alpha/beta hydrolase fold domain-containing protein [Micropruina sp.]